MAQSFFNSNAKVTGAALFPSFNSKEGSFYLRLIKQVGWNAEKKVGSFQGGKSINVKMSPDEMAEMVSVVNTKGKCSFYHAFGDNVTTGTFSYLEKDLVINNRNVKKVGFVLTVKSGDDEYRISFPPGAAVRFAEYVRFGLSHIFQADYAADKKAWEEKNKAKEGKEVKTPVVKKSIKEEYIDEQEPEQENAEEVGEDGEVVSEDETF